MPKKLFPYNQQGFAATYPWVWTWNVARSKGTGTPLQSLGAADDRHA
jgi:hypothetical protein